MKRLGLLSIIGCSVSGVAIAAGVDCNTIPTCAELGYTKSVADCEGQVVLRCPFEITNDNAVYCEDKTSSAPADPVEEKECALGDILYNDLKCYSPAPNGKTAVGVVFDTENKLAIGLRQTYIEWGGYGTDISTMTNFYSQNEALADTTGGKSNTQRIVLALGPGMNYAAQYCYDNTVGGLAVGDWFLPSLKELNTIYTNKSIINSAITNASGTSIVSSLYWSSTEYSSDDAWALYMLDGRSEGHSKDDRGSYNNHIYVRCAVGY